MDQATIVSPIIRPGNDQFYVLDDEKMLVPATYEAFKAMPEEQTIVGRDVVGPLTITTKFAGMDVMFDDEEPCFYETLVTGSDDPWTFGYFETWAEAQAGHARAVEHYRQLFAGELG